MLGYVCRFFGYDVVKERDDLSRGVKELSAYARNLEETLKWKGLSIEALTDRVISLEEDRCKLQGRIRGYQGQIDELGEYARGLEGLAKQMRKVQEQDGPSQDSN